MKKDADKKTLENEESDKAKKDDEAKFTKAKEAAILA